MFRARQQAAQRLLVEQGAAALVVVATSDLFYFTGVRWGLSERLFAWVLPQEGAPSFVCPAFEADRAAERIDEQAPTRLWQEHEDPFAQVAALIQVPGPVAFDPRGPWTFARRLGEASGRTVVDGLRISGPLRRRKSALELELIAHANGITRRAIKRALERLEPGVRGSQIAQWVREGQAAEGGGHPWVLALVGAAAAFPHGTHEEPVLQHGDAVLIDAGCQVHGYWSDLSRTVFFGEPDADAAKAWWAVQQAQQDAFAKIAPGVQAAAIDEAARASLVRSGYAGDYQQFTHRLGHGLGLDVHEDPYFVRDNAHPLEVGNTLSNEPGLYMPGRFGVRLEDIVAVTETGARWLSQRQTAPTVDGI